ncbi:SusC/RagA family TonB-linked outer membrane protein [Segatella copri]|uniref:TonB-linked outer membrane protein, SusC/RagA family n=1 Tax=Segatella copri DSM 18205 TaxID=537011 RepID=D1PCF9_9BACT|nr:TonB-dependent receptor [Segatella copri]EFB35611.1 TonB-linked outer membrane protein, SusC/RagA family [Segatella copri DSM 18205]MCW4097304.1 TonB-dependent receptor [Segatella copri]MQP19677.1 TonB-dependent receptor [Segatella copri DSM 18205]UEA43208.1 TonB-dependent receptor [Segatella copri DSM 18205]UWP52179.1 TonB-dependent receptor [Segatella copri DSM 18205]
MNAIQNLAKRSLLLVALFVIGCLQLMAQTRTIKGEVTDAQNGEALIGATVMVEGEKGGTVTDFDGNFSLQVSSSAKKIKVSYIGYIDKVLSVSDNMKVKLESDSKALADVVVIGYGTARKSDLTGSVATVKSKDFNKGLVSSPEQLINGKVSGVQIMSNSGSASAGSTIRVRGGASLNASNDPLIVLDGVPLEQGGISGNSSNFLSMINPSDIESMTVLKDASSTAIYGSRASNGVIIITTKKGQQGAVKVNFNTTNSLQTRAQMVDMLSRDEFVNVINQFGDANQKSLLGTANTDWNDVVYRTAFGTDNNLSVSGSIDKWLPFRVSVGYYNQSGLVRKDNVERWTGNVVLTPSFFQDHLKLTINAKGTLNNNSFNNGGAVWAAATFNPTIPVYSGNDKYGGYNEALDADGVPVNAGVRNPRGLVDLYDSKSKVSRFIGSMDVDYKVHFLPDLKLHATVGADYAKGDGTIYVPAYAAQSYNKDESLGGSDYKYGPQKNENRLLTLYANYAKYFEDIKSNVDLTAGYDYQYWKSTTPLYYTKSAAGTNLSTVKASDYRHVMLSYYGRINYSFDGKYLLTATVRRDASSRFSKDTRWGTFPSVALGWTLTEEPWLKNQKVLSNLKLRASYGVTGQQEGIGNYNYLPVYTYSVTGAEAFINGQYINTYRPEAYVSDLKWETTTSWNFGLDFGFLDGRIGGAIDFYTRKTKDLLASVPTAAGTNFSKTILTNVGNVDSKGIEVSLNATPIQTKDWEWNLSYNFTWQDMKVKNLSLTKGGSQTNVKVGPSIDAYQFQVLSEGYEPYMFYVYHQLYDSKTGKPIEGAYADLNNDGEINESDLYRYHSPAPKYIMGLSTSLRYKQLTLGMSFRANIDNYVYNGMGMSTGAFETVSYNNSQLNNLNTSFLKTGFKTRQYLSDYYVENASFLKLDNLSLSYNVGKINKWASLTVSAMVQNVFTITGYSGTDPEVPNGMDNSFYPRPRTYSVSLGLQF